MADTERRFSELSVAATLTDNDILALSQTDIGTSTLISVRATLIAIATHIAKVAAFTNDLDTTSKTLIGAINELKQLISLIPQFSIDVVQTLPVSDISETTIYLVPSSDPEQGNYYEEYIYVNNTWELVGTTAVDLSAYYTKLEVDGLLAAKANTSDVTAALALKEAKADLDDDVTDIVVGLTDEQTTAPGNPVTLTTEQSGGAKSALVTFAPKQSGTGDPSPTNIRPISGWDSLRLYQSGSNVIDGLVGLEFVKQEYYGNNVVIDTTNKTALLKMTVSQGYYPIIQMDTRSYPTYFPFKENTQYTFIFKAESTTTLLNMGVSYTDGTNNGGFRASDRDSEGYIVFTTPNDKSVRSLYLGNYSGQTTLYYETICVMEGIHTKAEWEAQNKTTHTVTFPDTIMGGSYDFVSGEGVNPWCAVKVDLGSLTYTYSTSGGGTFRSSDIELDVLKPASNDDKAEIMCECYTVQTANDVYRGVDGIGVTIGGKLWIHDARTTDPDVFKSLVSGLYLIYQLATPTPISLPPADVNLLKGSNTVWTDGDTVQVKYSELPNGNLGAVIDYIKKLEARIAALES